MLNTLKRLFSVPVESGETISYQKAIAALLMEVMLADHEIDPKEEIKVKEYLRSLSGLDEGIDELYLDARSGVDQANDLYQFTKVINDVASIEQKFLLLKGLWHVALADGDIDSYEDHRIRRISELLFMPHSEFIHAKIAAQKELTNNA
ncbi:TerB family tellurite resistance protein [Marinomonas pontica]|uniref:tellurite resistance TerB family protein n=1 Tax=Marinomonas pontica TaxID=264739 RepID=UPI002244EE6A|nr:TerB family tellurite resistance protein [Marinomonas pontica]MCW8355090.1 TerB family tellurite resistance protein [Marinomonas pontica]